MNDEDVSEVARLRLMRIEDVEAVRQVERASHGAAWPPTNFARELNENPVARYLVVEMADGSICGFAGIWIQMDEAHIVNVAVEPDQRGKGYGLLLVHGLMDLAMQYQLNVATLECRESNAIARSLYRTYGFYEVGQRKAYYADNGEDAVIMTTEDLSGPDFERRFEQLGRALSVRLPGVSLSIDPADVPDLRVRQPG